MKLSIKHISWVPPPTHPHNASLDPCEYTVTYNTPQNPWLYKLYMAFEDGTMLRLSHKAKDGCVVQGRRTTAVLQWELNPNIDCMFYCTKRLSYVFFCHTPCTQTKQVLSADTMGLEHHLHMADVPSYQKVDGISHMPIATHLGQTHQFRRWANSKSYHRNHSWGTASNRMERLRRHLARDLLHLPKSRLGSLTHIQVSILVLQSLHFRVES